MALADNALLLAWTEILPKERNYPLRHTISHALVLLVFMFAPLVGGSTAFAVQDQPLHQTLRFTTGQSSVTLKNRIRLGTSHVYHFRARKNQHLTTNLQTGKNTSLTIYSLKSGQPEGADGVWNWKGALPETGEYIIEIGTDRTTSYELTVTIE